eukprot:365728-Chlamydomonas_euryale.AAC.3
MSPLAAVCCREEGSRLLARAMSARVALQKNDVSTATTKQKRLSRNAPHVAARDACTHDRYGDTSRNDPPNTRQPLCRTQKLSPLLQFPFQPRTLIADGRGATSTHVCSKASRVVGLWSSCYRTRYCCHARYSCHDPAYTTENV